MVTAQPPPWGAANANAKLAGEVIGIISGPNPAEVRSGLDAICDVIENDAYFISANEDGAVVYYAHCIVGDTANEIGAPR